MNTDESAVGPGVDPVVAKIIREHRESNRLVLIVLGILVLVILVLGPLLVVTVSNLSHSNHGLTDSVEAQKATVDRTECVRAKSNDINDERWTDLAVALDGLRSKDDVKVNESIDKLVKLSGLLGDQIANECPAAIGTTSAGTTTTTTGGS